ncbi:hypothetical protein ARMSODRAFT_1023634 [Armillaria solidipes]|uniref:Uncharacterized protein n=1 Tax=Armillaria solidipes TaxID=1076256 RepID=A0A2H3B9P4_9AGAR|nr:hypothetical protein ARMSODRAFT_1023634 [Armillaria solidipes]
MAGNRCDRYQPFQALLLNGTCLPKLNYALLNSASQLNAFHDADVDSSHGATKLGTVSITLGVVFFAACLIEIFGFVCAVMRQLALIRVYVNLTFISGVSLAAAGIIDAIAYFAFADCIIEERQSLASSRAFGAKSLFRGSPWPTHSILHMENATQCGNAWSNHASNEILAILFFYLIPSTLSYLLAYIYHRQTHDQQIRRRGSIRMGRLVNNSVSISPGYNSYSDRSPAGPERPKAGNRRGVPLTSPVKGSRWSDSSTVSVSLSPGPPSYGAGTRFGQYDVQLTGYADTVALASLDSFMIAK